MSQKLNQIELKEDAILRVSFSLLLSGLAALIGLVFWLSNLSSSTEANATEIHETQDNVAQIVESLNRIDKKLSAIQALLERKISD
jgi:Mg2+ and Co2+ transporter CorA